MKAIHNGYMQYELLTQVVANLLKVKNESNSQHNSQSSNNRWRCGKSTKSKE